MRIGNSAEHIVVRFRGLLKLIKADSRTEGKNYHHSLRDIVLDIKYCSEVE